MRVRCPAGRPRRRLSVRDLPVTRSEMLEAVAENGLDKHFVEFAGGHFSNHLVQAAAALHHLGASRERFGAFVEHYIAQLEPADGPTRAGQDAGVEDMAAATVEELKGE